MKTSSLLGLGLCLAALSPQAARAGVRVSVGFGFPAYGSCGPGYPAPRQVYCSPPGYFRPRCAPVYYPSPMVYYPRYEPYYVEPQRVVVVRETSYAPAPAPVMESEASYARLGRDWAHDLRNEVATWDQFVNYLRANLVRGPSSAYAEFRSGFLAAYGVNAEAAFNKAYQEAR